MSQTFAAQDTFAGPFSAILGGEHLGASSSCGTCVSMRVIQQRVEPEFNARRLVGMALRGRANFPKRQREWALLRHREAP